METRNCQNCKKDFIIETDDFLFYEKIKVPPPTFCPECRLERRLIWMKGVELFKRKCDLCGEIKLSMYHPSAPYIVYCDRCWWSDKWDPKDFARDYNPDINFLEQWNELLHQTPILGLSIDKVSSNLSPYTNHVGNSKNCYLIYYSDYAEDSAFCYQLTHTKNVYNSGTIMEVDGCYDSSHVYKSYNIICGVGNNRSCYDCYFIRDCEGCHHCFGLTSAKNMSYVFLGEQLSKIEYEKRIKEINLGSYLSYQEWKNKVNKYFLGVSPRPSWDTLSREVSGSYVFHSKNCKECFDVIDCEDSKFLMSIKIGKVRNSYDYVDWGENVELVYEGITVGNGASNIRFVHESGHNIRDIEYSKLSTGGAHHFGCVSIRKTEYCILNKQYTKEEYIKLREKIIKDMNNNPYISKVGHVYKYGEFFPPEFSPHAYNDSFAFRFNSLTKEEAISSGLKWNETEKREYEITLKVTEIPDDIKNINEKILSEVIQCSTCQRGYKIIPQELQFLKKLNLPLPHQCPFCRVGDKINEWVLNMKLHKRNCHRCQIEFITHYSKERAPVIFCKDCYKQEVY